MYEVAEQVSSWLAQGRDVRIAQVVETTGFSSRDPAAALAWTDGKRPVGTLLDGGSAEPLAGTGLVRVDIPDAHARAVGLSCGGTARVLVQPASAYPAELWDRLLDHEPVCVTTTLDAGQPSGVAVHTPADVGAAFGSDDTIPRLFGRGVSATALLDDARTAVVALWPVPTLVVVGDGLIAAALADFAALLGWHSHVTDDVDAGVAAAHTLHRSDAFVVLSHKRPVDGPTLAAALAGDAGYVGALGSRRTQAARREWLTEHDVAAGDQGRIHGPAGLDLDAHTPGEIAVSIIAEIIAARSPREGGAGSLRDRPGPIHGAGVQAPPPRY